MSAFFSCCLLATLQPRVLTQADIQRWRVWEIGWHSKKEASSSAQYSQWLLMPGTPHGSCGCNFSSPLFSPYLFLWLSYYFFHPPKSLHSFPKYEVFWDICPPLQWHPIDSVYIKLTCKSLPQTLLYFSFSLRASVALGLSKQNWINQVWEPLSQFGYQFYFIALIKHHDKVPSTRKSLLWAFGSRGLGSKMLGTVGSWNSSWELTYWPTQAKRNRGKCQESLETLKSIPSNILPSARPHP